MSHTCIERLRAIQTEFNTIRLALTLSDERWDSLQDYFLMRRQSRANVRLAFRRLEDTYIIRLFSEFEAILREFCQEIGVKAPYKAENLLNRVAARRTISADIRAGAHHVRERRNTIVHGNGNANEITFVNALSALSRFLAWLPEP